MMTIPPGKFDQTIAEVRDRLPALWWALYIGCIEKGFTADQAMVLLKAFISSHNSDNKEKSDESDD